MSVILNPTSFVIEPKKLCVILAEVWRTAVKYDIIN